MRTENLLNRRKAIITFLVLALAYFLSTLIRAITATLAPTLVHELSLSAAELGLLAGGYFLGFSFTQLPLGAWLDRFGPKRVEVTFLVVAVAGCLAFSMASSFTGLLLARILCGIGVSSCLMAPLTGYRRWYAPATLMRANSWMLMVGALGAVASTLPVQWLLPQMGWRPIFVLLALAVALAALLMVWQIPAWQQSPIPVAGVLANSNSNSNSNSSAATGYAEIWRSRYFQSLMPLAFVGYGGMVAMQTLWVTPWMVHMAGFSGAQAAAGLFWISIAMLLSYWVWGLINPRLARRGIHADWLILHGVPLSLIPLLLLVWLGQAAAASAPWILGSYCVLATVNSQAQPAVGISFRPALAGRALSAYNLVVFCGVFAVQWGMGLVMDGLRAQGWAEAAAYQGAWALYALCYLLAYLYFLGAKKT
ncbi:MAG: MFS transporter [Rhodoferax sp.]|nr:MFS transporter [Rhodoferax sp.]